MDKIYAVILAAGTSSRLGFNKLTLKIDGRSVIQRAVEPFCFEGIEKIFVVTNPEQDDIKKELELLTHHPSPITLVCNANYTQGMSSSIKAVLPFIEDADIVFFHLGDKPFIKKEMVSRMLEMSLRKNIHIIVPEYESKKGHPVMVKIKPYREEMKSLKGDSGLREMVDKYPEDVLFIEGGEGNIFDIDTAEDVTLLEKRGYRIEKG